MEDKMIRDIGVPFQGVMTGKVRRYFSWRNVLDVFKIPVGIAQAIGVLRRFKPQVLFAKGGFVSFPAAVAAWILRIPVVLHESDVVPGLANRMCARFATRVCVSFEESREYFSKKDVIITGNPIRKSLREGNADAAKNLTGLHGGKPVVLVMGGSQGAGFLNQLVWEHMDEFLKSYQVIHICGKGKKKNVDKDGYKAFEFVGKELKDLYALADVVVTRSGAMTLAEIGALGLPAILIPLSKKVSRGDQIVNAKAFAKSHVAHVMEEDSFEITTFWKFLEEFASTKKGDVTAADLDSAHTIIELLESL